MSSSQVQHHWPGRQVPFGGGYVEVNAPDRETAEKKVWETFGARWAFFYIEFDSIHELDRNLLGEVTAEPKPEEATA